MSAGRRYRNLSRSQITHYVASSPTRPSSFEAYPASPSPRAAACASGLNESAWAEDLRQKARALPQPKDLIGALDLA